MENVQLPSPARHPSYQNHRRQLWTQILLPLLAVKLLLLLVIVLMITATFRDNGDVARWAALSTMWVVLPLLAAGLLILIIFGAMIYGMARLLVNIPPYTGQAQKMMWRVEARVKRATELAVKPIFSLEAVIASFKHLFGMK